MAHTKGAVATKEIMLKVRLDRKLAARLARLARRKGVTKSAVMREAIELAEREMRRQEALRALVAQAEEDQRRLAGRRPRPEKFSLG